MDTAIKIAGYNITEIIERLDNWSKNESTAMYVFNMSFLTAADVEEVVKAISEHYVVTTTNHNYMMMEMVSFTVKRKPKL